MDGEQSLDFLAQEFDRSMEPASSSGQLSKPDLQSLAEFFLLLARWDRMSTAVTEEPAAREQNTA